MLNSPNSFAELCFPRSYKINHSSNVIYIGSKILSQMLGAVYSKNSNANQCKHAEQIRFHGLQVLPNSVLWIFICGPKLI